MCNKFVFIFFYKKYLLLLLTSSVYCETKACKYVKSLRKNILVF